MLITQQTMLDDKGQPLTDFTTAPSPEPEPPSTITIDSVLEAVKKQKEPESDDVSEKITDLRLTSLTSANSGKKDTDETSEAKTIPLIQEIAATPRHKVLRQNGEITLFVELPNVVCIFFVKSSIFK
jgi:hypothetical protein